MVPKFLGTIVQNSCPVSDTAPTARAYTLYFDLVYLSLNRTQMPGWTEEDLERLKEDVINFRGSARGTFKSYQPSGIGTPERHALDLFTDAILRVGAIEHLHSRRFPHYRSRCNKSFRPSSERIKIALSETLRWRQVQMLQDDACEGAFSTYRADMGSIQAVQEETAYLVCSGPEKTVQKLFEAQKCMYENRQNGSSLVPVSPVLKEMCGTLEKDGIHALNML